MPSFTLLASSTSGLVHPFVILAIGISIVIGLILFLRVNAFIALIMAAIAVSLMAGGETGDKITRVAEAFGDTAGKIGIVIALAAVIGTCMMDSGAADRIVRAFLSFLGEKRASVALMGSGFVLAVPVFFDTVFYLLVPLARSLYRKTGKNYLLYLMAIAAGGAITHTLVPPTPGPLIMAATLNVGIGLMILVGAAVALPAAIAGLAYASFADRTMTVPMREIGTAPPPEPLDDDQLPSLGLSLLPVLLPVLMISGRTIIDQIADGQAAEHWAVQSQPTMALIGDPNIALLVSTIIAVFLYWQQRRPTLVEISEMVETSLMSGGAIILITAGGGAFGAMLKEAEIGSEIQKQFTGVLAGGAGGLMMLVLGFLIAAVLKIAQGSSTVAMITVSGMLAAMVGDMELGFHPVYLCTAIGAGSLIGSWMNDSGFWIFTKMGGLTEAESLKSWTPMLLVLGTVSFVMTVLYSQLLPMAPVSGS